MVSLPIKNAIILFVTKLLALSVYESNPKKGYVTFVMATNGVMCDLPFSLLYVSLCCSLRAWPHWKLFQFFSLNKPVFLCISYEKLKKLPKRSLVLVSHKENIGRQGC